jgi:hypothetical protein
VGNFISALLRSLSSALTQEPERYHSQWKPTFYRYPGYSNHITHFSDPRGFPPLETIPPEQYYSHDTYVEKMAFDSPKVPDDLERSLEIVFELDTPRRERFLRACRWFSHARQFWTQSQSISFISMVAALECLMDKSTRCAECHQALPEEVDHCDTCGQPKYRVNRSFKDFLDTNVPFIDELPEERNLLYGVRSQLVHGLDLLYSDLNRFAFGEPRDLQERHLHSRLHLIVPVAAHTWIQRQSQLQDRSHSATISQ